MADEGADVIFGDGFFAVMLNALPHPTNSNKKICMMLPAKLTKKAFSLDDSDQQRNRLTGAYAMEYSKDDMIPLNRWAYGISWLFLCNWKGEKTDIVERINIEHLEVVKFLRRKVALLELQIASMFKGMEKRISQPELLRIMAEKSWLDHYTAAVAEGENKKEVGQGVEQYG